MADREIPVFELPSHDRELLALLESGDIRAALAGPIRELVLQAHRDNFTSSASPEGENWAPRKRLGDGHPLLMESGALLQAATGGGAGHVTEVESRELRVGVDTTTEEGGIPGAIAHEFGDPRRNLPPRPWVGASEATLQKIDELVADAFFDLIDGGL